MECTCHHNARSITINGVLRGDPTRTLTLRRSFEAQMIKRFAIIKKAIIQAVDTDDVFGLRERRPTTLQELQPRQFEFLRSDQKVKAFMDWLKEMKKKHLLTVTYRPGVHQGEQPWTNYYIQSAYQRGMNRARQELRKKGYDVPRGEGPLRQDSIGVAFNQPFHAERVAMVYTRVYNELDGITSAMDQQISRVLALGMAEGKSPYAIARDITGRVDAIGLNRARTLARTEIVSAHHQATINEYEQWGVHGVSVQAEWMTAGFGVCPICQKLARGGDIGPGIYSLNAIRNMIPVHPNCRCVALPMVKEN